MSETANSETLERPLAGVRILELVDGPMRSAGRLLAELGADVVQLAPKKNDHNEPDSRRYFLDYGKSRLEVTDAADTIATKLCEIGTEADIVLVSGSAVSAEELDRIRAKLSDKVIVAISPFGLEGECSDWILNEPVFFAMSGVLSNSGVPDHPPLLPPPGLAYGSAAAQLVLVALIAYWNKLRSGKGDFVDFSVFEGAAFAYDPGYGVAGSASAGVPAYMLPRGRPEARFRYPIIPCKDGYARICLLAKRQWRNMFRWMGKPEQFADPEYDKLSVRFADPDLIPAIAKFFASMTREEIEQGGREYGVPVAAVLSLSDAMQAEHFAERDAFADIATEDGKIVRLINGMIEIDSQRMGVSGLSCDTAAGATFSASQPVEKPDFAPSERPFEGMKVLDLGVIVVGAEQGRVFADQGADVIKVETSAFPDGTRQSIIPGTIPTGFAAGNRSKRGLSINLSTAKGLEIFERLASEADVLLSNYKPGTLEKLGIDYESLSAINPEIIVVENSAYGPTGSWAQRMGYGPLVRASTGMTALYSYPDNPNEYGDSLTVYPDHVGGRLGPIGALALLINRARSKRGGRVAVAQAEILLQHMGELIADGRDRPVEPDAPYGVFPAMGDDEWVVVAVENDAQWLSLCEALKDPALTGNSALQTAEGRRANRAAIDSAVKTWLAGRPPAEAAADLQRFGVPAAQMLRISELPEAAPFRDRKVFKSYKHPSIEEEFLVERSPTKFSSIPEPDPSPAPLIAEHTETILRDMLGFSDEEVKAMAEAEEIELPG